MIAFATLFLGLVLGVNDVTLIAGPEAARAVLLLDGAEIAELRGKPWTATVDLGPELAPHELVAVAFDKDGREAGTVRQWINRPRPPAEASVVIERRGDTRVARLSWQSIVSAAPKFASVTVDGEPVPFADAHEVTLPDVDRDRLHVLHAELDFDGGVSVVQDVAFGGARSDEAAARLTAFPLLLEKKVKMPPPARLAGWFTLGGSSLTVAGVEEGPAEIVVVPHETARPALEEIAHDVLGPPVAAVPFGFRREVLRSFASLKKDQRVHVVWPQPHHREHSGFRYDLFPRSEELTSRDGGMLWFLTNVRYALRSEIPVRLADAVAVAGLHAAARDRRRAVVLVLGPEPPPADSGRLAPQMTRRYLERLGVPLFVWCAGRERDPEWGACRDVSSAGKLDAATKELTTALERQRIVWLEGTFLPHAVGFTGDAGVTRLAR